MMAFTTRIVERFTGGAGGSNVCKVADPLSLHINELEDAWCRFKTLGLADWRSGVVGRRKSTRAEHRGWDWGDQDFSSKYISGVAFLLGYSFIHIATNKEMDTVYFFQSHFSL